MRNVRGCALDECAISDRCGDAVHTALHMSVAFDFVAPNLFYSI